MNIKLYKHVELERQKYKSKSISPSVGLQLDYKSFDWELMHELYQLYGDELEQLELIDEEQSCQFQSAISAVSNQLFWKLFSVLQEKPQSNKIKVNRDNS